MKAASRLLANVVKYEAGLPTGLTGLLTHTSPRSTLLYLYSSTLDSLNRMPDHSVYKKSTEALTEHRMRIIESIKPPGLQEWQQRVAPLVDAHPDAVKRVKTLESKSDNDFNIVYREPDPERFFQNDDEKMNVPYKSRPQTEGPGFFEEKDVSDRGKQLQRDMVAEERSRINIEAEPSLTMEQIGEVEQLIGAGLIEEVIAVAEGEKRLAEKMEEYKV